MSNPAGEIVFDGPVLIQPETGTLGVPASSFFTQIEEEKK